jgi:hypothetical protein
VNDYYYFSRPTYAALIRLLDNYNHVVGGAEHSNSEEVHEIATFLDAISKTTVMQKTLLFLHQHGTYCDNRNFSALSVSQSQLFGPFRQSIATLSVSLRI